jgi:hypothetical protein
MFTQFTPSCAHFKQQPIALIRQLTRGRAFNTLQISFESLPTPKVYAFSSVTDRERFIQTTMLLLRAKSEEMKLAIVSLPSILILDDILLILV